MSALLLKFLLSNILFSLILGALLVRINKKWNTSAPYSTFELVLYSLGLGPVFTVLILYYLLLIIPHRPHLFYLAVVGAIYLLLLILGRKGFPEILRKAKASVKTLWATPGKTVYWCILLAVLLGVLALFPGSILKTPIEGHDALIYGNFGKVYYQEKQVPYEKVMTPRKKGFFFPGSTKPSFSLLLTWEMMLNTKDTNKTREFDLYFRSISGYYGILITAVVFLWLYRKNKYLALLGMLVLLSGLRFFLMLTDYHLDSFRIFFLMLSWIWLAYTIKETASPPHKGIPLSFLLLGVFSGFTAFAHLIGLVVAVVNGLAFFLFVEENFRARALKTALFFLSVLVFGGIHYVLEALFGSAAGFLTYISL